MVTALAFAAPTHAMTYSYRLAPNNRIVVNAVGKIEANEPAILTNWLGSLPPKFLKRQVAIFLFNSPGGNVIAAEKLTEAIQGLPEHPDTGVVAGGICASACVLPWSVGTHKYARQATPRWACIRSLEPILARTWPGTTPWREICQAPWRASLRGRCTSHHAVHQRPLAHARGTH